MFIFCYRVRVRFGFVKFSNLRVRVRLGSVRKSRVRVRFGFGLDLNPGSSRRQANIKLKLSKCAFRMTLVIFLGVFGHVISDKVISTGPVKLRCIKKWPRLHNPDEARSYLGYATYYRKFIKNFAHIVEPLNKLLMKNRQFQLTKECENFYHNKGRLRRHDYPRVFRLYETIHRRLRRERLRHWRHAFENGNTRNSTFCISAERCQSRNANTRLPANRYWRLSIRWPISVATFSVESLKCVLTTAHCNC